MSLSPVRAALRLTWTIGSILVVQTLVCALAAAPIVALWLQLVSWTAGHPLRRIAVLSLAAGPSYAAFALLLMVVSPLVTRAVGWRTPVDAKMRLADLEWPLLQWVRYMAALHVVRVIAGSLARGTPVWTAYLRWSGARLGRRVYVNSLSLSDYHLLEFGDDVVIGADAHISGHTVVRGVVITAPVRLGNGVTIGVGAVVDIGVVAGDRCQVGALAVVPRFTVLEADTTYVGIPAHPLDSQHSSQS